MVDQVQRHLILEVHRLCVAIAVKTQRCPILRLPTLHTVRRRAVPYADVQVTGLVAGDCCAANSGTQG